ncbi:hypothetical protein COO20_04240 [Thalassospira marina]|uniref:Uncharacterized protein n=1 Tax=Thalassospira marina TaxID=2048283 RepID=A0A2N3KXX6_9PROT|nr:hypothetical protein COO20_04240 [Thalassospira marina]
MTPTLHRYTRVSTTVQQTQGTSLQSQEECGITKANELGFEYKLQPQKHFMVNFVHSLEFMMVTENVVQPAEKKSKPMKPNSTFLILH